MQPHDKPQFLAALNGLAAIKPGAKLTTEGLSVWWTALEHWPIEDFRQACAHLARSCEFMPNPFHFEQLRKAALPTAGEAWSAALEYARGNAPAPTDPVTARAVRAIGGYQAIRMSKVDATHFLERRFAEHYDAIGGATETRDAMPQLRGPQSVANLLGREP